MLLTSKLSCLLTMWLHHVVVSCGYVMHAGISLLASNLVIEKSFTAEDFWLDTAFTLPANPPPAAETSPQPLLPSSLSGEGYAPYLPLTSTHNAAMESVLHHNSVMLLPP